MTEALEFSRDELIGDPETRSLVNGKSIVVFNIKRSEKISTLNTSNKFLYQNEFYEVMNRESVDSPSNYVKFNCIRKIAAVS